MDLGGEKKVGLGEKQFEKVKEQNLKANNTWRKIQK